MASEEEDGAFTVKSSDLKTSLRELAFRDDEDINPESLARAREMISVLEEIDLKNGADSNSGYAISFKVPDHFKCPLSNKLMRDPVLLHSSGETYDRNSIEAWIRLGNVTSPLTLAKLSGFDLTPNTLIRNTITTWCENRGIKLVKGNLEEGGHEGVDFNLIKLLVDYVRLWKGNVQARANAAAALYALSLVDSNKALIGECGGLAALVSLLEKGDDELEMKEAACAIHRLCTLPSNKERAIGDGGVRVVMEKIKDGVLVGEMVEILALFATNDEAVVRMNNLGAVHRLFKIIREKPNHRCKECCVAILNAISYNDRVSWKEVKREEKGRQTVSKLVLEGTPMASCFLAKLRRSGLRF